MRIAIATFSGMPPEFRDDELLLERLAAADPAAELLYRPWDDAEVDWEGCDLVVARSPWDYATRQREFLAWVERVGARLENAAELISWNSDKRYLGELGEAGIPVVETNYVLPGTPAPEIDSEVVIKPTVSAGARSTGRFGPASAAQGQALIERITADGGIAMVQPFVEGVDSDGETAIVTFAGEISHVLHKHAVLGPDEIAPIRDDDALGVAEAMYDPDLVVDGSAEPDQLELARRVISFVAERFGRTPLTARVDMLRDGEGEPVLLELEAIEPNLYFPHAPEAADRLTAAILTRAAERESPSAPR